MLNSKNWRGLLLAPFLAFTGAAASAAQMSEQQAVAALMKIAHGDTQGLASLRQLGGIGWTWASAAIGSHFYACVP